MTNHATEDERKNRIKRVLELISSGMSFRQCADYLSENEFKISHVTVRDYVNRARLLNYDLSTEAQEVIDNNKPKTIKDEEVKQRVIKVYQLLANNYTIEEVAKALETTPMVVYRDFTNRLQSLNEEELKEMGISKEKIEEIKNNMTQKSLANLKNRK